MDDMDVPSASAAQDSVSNGIATFNAGNAAWRAGRWQEALDAYTQAAADLQPMMADAHLGRARCLVHLGQIMAAREAFATVLRLEPTHYSAWLEAGHLCHQMGELQQAAAAYQRAIHANPKRHEAFLGMARTLQQLGHVQQAEQAFSDALAGVPVGTEQGLRQADIAHRMGQYRLALGDAAGAARALQTGLQALSVGKNLAGEARQRAEIQIDLGEALWRLGQTQAAQQAFTAASGAEDEATLVRLATLSFRLNLWQEALAVLSKNRDLHPHSANAHGNLAHLLAESWQMDEAERMLQHAENLGPIPGARSMRASIAGRLGDADTALRLYRELAAEPDAPAGMASSAAMSSLYSDSLSAQDVADLHRALFAPLGKDARRADSFVRAPLDGRRIRLGMVSADFHHQHPINIFMQPVLREIDRSRFDVFLYFTGSSHDAQTRLAQDRAEHWVEAATLNDVQLAKRIDADQIDLLLDLGGHTGQQRMRLFAQRAAPVQATYLGYPCSTGLPNMDWIVGDAVVTPPEHAHLYSEQVMRLPHAVFCFAPEEAYPFPRYTQAHAERPLTFGSFNNVPKLTSRTLRLWANVLRAVPGSRLLLKAPSLGDARAVALFTERLQALGVAPERLAFRGPTGLTDMMAEYEDVDIALDPVPYNGGTTSLQALWMGVPVLTMRGEYFVSRMGASFMTAAGLPEWIAENDEDYVAIAARMAADRQALLALKLELRERLLARPAWDAVAHARAMEGAFERMLGQAKHCGVREVFST